MAKQVSPPNSVTAVEAIAASRAVTFAKEIGLNSIVLDRDSAVVIDSLKNDKVSLANYGHLIEEVKDNTSFFAICGFLLLKVWEILLLITLLDMLAISKCGRRMFLLI